MIEIGDYVKQSYGVKAIRVTKENMDEVAAWCGGVVKESTTNESRSGSNSFIELTVSYYRKELVNRAWVGCWVLKVDGEFKVYKNRAFKATFEQSKKSDNKKRSSVMKLVADVMSKQDLMTYYQDNTDKGRILDEYTNKILEVL